MAGLPRVLGLVLTIWIVGLRSTPTVRTDSPDSVWWGTKESTQLRKAAGEQIRAGNYAAVEVLFTRAAEQAQQHQDRLSAARYLEGAATARMMRFDYRGALRGYLEARALAETTGDRVELGSLALNLSSLYGQEWDLDSALRSAEQARAAAEGARGVYYRAQLFLQLGRLHGELGDQDPEPWFQQGIEAARATPDAVALEARGWDLLGQQRLASGRLAAAERAHLQAFYLRRLFVPRDLGLSYTRLGALSLAQGKVREAQQFTQSAFGELARGSLNLPSYLLYYQRGRIRLAQGRDREALKDLEKASQLALEWRAALTPALSALDGAGSHLGERILDAFVTAAADYGMKTGDSRRTEQSFQVAEITRAATMNDSQALAEIWRARMPPEYWATLSKLQAQNNGPGARNRPTERTLKLKLTEMEAQAGFGFSSNTNENFPSRSSLIHFQHGLRESELVVSFDLGEARSLVWTVTRDSFRVHTLPPRARVREAIQRFRDSVEASREDKQKLGSQLYTMLFGQLSPGEARKPEWLLSLEDALFELPFAALVSELGPTGPQYLAEAHSLQVVPGALLLEAVPRPQIPSGTKRLLAIADPIYNSADPRWAKSSGWFTPAYGAAPLSRLPGTAREVQLSRPAWTGSQTILMGIEARRDRFVHELSSAPDTIHLATHVLTPAGSRDQAFLAFGLGPDGRSELMTTSDVAMLNVRGALVVMTGCSTAPSDLRAGAGLAGLTRAWLMAGARAVAATQWAVKDSTGELLVRFYTHLREQAPAEALRRSQIDLIHAGMAPAEWAGFMIFGGTG